MIVVKNYPLEWHKDYLDLQKFIFADFTLEFTEDEYRAFTDLIADTKEDPVELLKAIVEEGLYAIMQPE